MHAAYVSSGRSGNRVCRHIISYDRRDMEHLAYLQGEKRLARDIPHAIRHLCRRLRQGRDELVGPPLEQLQICNELSTAVTVSMIYGTHV